MKEFTLRSPVDAHVHFRQGVVLEQVVQETEMVFGQAVVMPNTDPWIETAKDVRRYCQEIENAGGIRPHTPRMTIGLTKRTTPQVIREAFVAGAIAAKLYPQGATTNSGNGIPIADIPDSIADILREMARVGMVLCVHGEDPRVYHEDREVRFFETLKRIVDSAPDLKIVLEHISTERAALAIASAAFGKNVAATITAHHLVLTGDDVRGDRVRPHYHCLPCAKRPQDRDALIEFATSGHSSFFFGSDSAPHIRSKKECAEGAAGCYTAPVALPILMHVFENAKRLKKESLVAFTSTNFSKFYGIKLSKERPLMLERNEEPWVPEVIICGDGQHIVPFKPPFPLHWQVV